MTNLSRTRVLSAKVEFFEQKFRTPIQLSSGLIDVITEARATVQVQMGDRKAEGRGSIYLSDLWAWPDPTSSHEHRDAVLRNKCVEVAVSVADIVGEPAHPLELGLRLHHAICEPPGDIPILARALCMAPFDAAIHDAAGQILEKSAFRFYEEGIPIPTADHYFPGGTCQAIAKTLRAPKEALDGWWLVSAHDSLNGDLAEAIRKHGFGCFKLKILGRNIKEDVQRTAAVYEAVRWHGVATPKLSLDSNEGHVSAEAVREFLEELQRENPSAYEAVCYLEQPTSRDIRQGGFNWQSVAACKPVLLDEGLTSLDLLPLVLEQGWSGLALKTCKGHSFNLVAAAWAHRNGLLLAMQDLTNPGLAAIHSWLLAAHLPVINGIELNSPQFTPQANAPWLPELSGLFDIRDGKHRLDPKVAGLGTHLRSSIPASELVHKD